MLVVLVVGVAAGAAVASGSTERLLQVAGLTDKTPTPESDRDRSALTVNDSTPSPTADQALEHDDPESSLDRGPATPGADLETASIAADEAGELNAATAPDNVEAQQNPEAPAAQEGVGAGAAATPTEDGPAAAEADRSPTGLVELYAARWSAGDYGGLYDLLTAEARQGITRDDFVARYDGIAAEAGLTSVKATVSGEPTLEAEVPIHVVMESRFVGTVEEDNTVAVIKEGDVWRVAWTPSLIFKDLGENCIEFSGEDVRRGSILDRDGDALALDGTISQIGIVPGQITNEASMLRALSKLVDMTTAEIKEKYEDGQPDWFMPVKDFPEQMDQKILNGIAPLDGVAVRTRTARVYPLGAKAAHITGYVSSVTAEDLEQDESGLLSDGDLLGRAGIEAAANDLLTGVPGGILAVVDCGSRVQRTEIATRRGEPAKDLVLTVDRDLQVAVDKALGDVKGSAVVLDPRTGAVLALASHPTFDPNWFVLGFSDEDWAYINDEKERPLLNRATQAAYPTGSIFKVITMAAAMEHLDYTGQSEIDCPQQWSIPGTSQVWRDWTVDEGVGAQGLLTLHNALVQSCNTVFYQLGFQLDEKDDQLLPAMTKAFGLGEPTEIPYFQEVAGTVPDPEWKQEVVGDFWANGDAVNLAIGQGFLEATPLQMAVAYAAIGNNGSILRPFIVEYANAPGGGSERIGERKGVRSLPISRENLREIQSALRDQTSNSWGAGSSRVFADFQYPIAGKTGTAQNEANLAGKPHAWFAAFGPSGEKATIATIVMVESSGEGVEFSAPRTREIFEAYLETDLAEDSGGS